MIAAEAERQTGAVGHGSAEHSAHCPPIELADMHGKANDSAAELVRDDHHSVSSQKQRLTAKQVETPQAVLRMPDKGQPGWARRTGFGPIVFCGHAADDILVDLQSKGERELLSDPTAAEARVYSLDLDDGSDDVF
jgi:hypothetical protein